ncbi:hypothetical protein FRC18_006718, partial [Serendipita sp. 400]
MRTQTPSGKHYWIKLLRSKDEAFAAFNEYRAYAENLTGRTIKVLHVGVFLFYSYSSYGCVHSSTFTHSLAVYCTGGKWYEFSLVAHYHSAP